MKTAIAWILFDALFGLFFQGLAWLHGGALAIAAFAWFHGDPWLFAEWKQLVYFPLMGIVSQVVAFQCFRQVQTKREDLREEHYTVEGNTDIVAKESERIEG